MAVNPLDVYGIVADPALSADEKRSKIDMLYGAGVPTPSAPDARTASNDVPLAFASAMDARPAPPPVASDAGGMSGMSMAPAVSAPPPAPAPAVSAPPPVAPPAPEGANMSTPTGSIAAPPPVVPETTSGGEAPVEPQSPSDDALITAGTRAVATGLMRGSPARRIAAHDQPTASVIEKTAPLPDDVKERLATDAEAEAGLALNEGEEAGKAHLDAAIAADNTAHQARTDEAQLQEANKRAEAHVQHLDQQFEQMVKDTAIKPSDWWASKDAGHKVLSVISAIMFGLGGSPQGLQKVIDDDLAMKERMRQSKLGAFKQRIDDFKSRLMSPEAQHASERALAAQAVAADANRLAESAAAPEARLRAQQVAQHFQSEFDQWSAKMAASEAGTVRTNIAHVPDQVTGGGKSPAQVLDYLINKLHMPYEQAVKVMAGGQYSSAGADDAKTRVILPDQTVGYTSEDLHKQTQEQMDSLHGLQSNLARIKELSGKTGHTLAGQDKARLQALVADTTTQLSGMARGEGANARMAGEMLDILKPLTGAGALDSTTWDTSTRAGIDEASRLYKAHVESIKNRLTPTAKTAPSGGKIKTLGKSKEDLGFEPSG